MKDLILRLVFFLYRKDYYEPLSEPQIAGLIKRLANTSGLEDLPRYLEQCSVNARNQYLYTNDPIFKGTIIAFTTLKKQIEKEKAPIKKNLTEEEKIGIMRARGY